MTGVNEAGAGPAASLELEVSARPRWVHLHLARCSVGGHTWHLVLSLCRLTVPLPPHTGTTPWAEELQLVCEVSRV